MSLRAIAICCPMSASAAGCSSTVCRRRICPRPVEVVPTDGAALRRALDPHVGVGASPAAPCATEARS